MKNVVWIVVFAAYFCVAAAGVTADLPPTAPVYVVELFDDPVAALQEDAKRLGLDLQDTTTVEDANGWTRVFNEDFEIRRAAGSGFFTYIDKGTEWVWYERRKEPVAEADLLTDALELLEAVGCNPDEVHHASIHRIAAQSEDEAGKAVGPEDTMGFLVYVHRQLDGFPVHDSYGKVVFTADGQLHKIQLHWRVVDPVPAGYLHLADPTTLAVEARVILEMNNDGQPVIVRRERFGYVEEPKTVAQATMELKYVVYYQAFEGSFLDMGVFDASE